MTTTTTTMMMMRMAEPEAVGDVCNFRLFLGSVVGIQAVQSLVFSLDEKAPREYVHQFVKQGPQKLLEHQTEKNTKTTQKNAHQPANQPAALATK